MKKILKLALIPATFLVASATLGCNKSTAEIALITDVGDIDDGSFNQSSWEAIKTFCADPSHPLSHEYYRPFADSEFARELAVKQAVAKGAKVIILPGFKFAGTVGKAQIDYPNVKFLLLDSDTSNFELPNTCCVNYNPEYSGYIAGYAIANDLCKYDFEHENHIHEAYNYGYCGGMGYPTVFTFAYGFIQGIVRATADYCNASSLNANLPQLNFNYNYAGVFAQDDPAAARMKDWYAAGTEVIFACGGKLYQSVTEGVKDYNQKNGFYNFEEGNPPRNAARWVGVDTDQYLGLKDDHEKKTIITSALKRLDETINTVLDYYSQGRWDIVGTKVGSETQDEGFASEEEALNYINDKDNSSKFSFYNTEIKKCEDDKYRILLHTSDEKISYFYNANQVHWQLGLNSVLGNETVAEKSLEPKNYVGIPEEADKGEEDTLRGFYSFKKKDLINVRNKIIKTNEGEEGNDYYVYGGTGADIYVKKGESYEIDETLASDNFGNPVFMSQKSNEYFIEDNNNYIAFNTRYFGGYDASKITINII